MFRPDRLVLAFSPTLAVLVVGVHLAASLAVLLSALAVFLKALLLGLIVWQSIRLLRRYVWLSHPGSVCEIRWTEQTWFVRLKDGAELEVAPVRGCRVLGWITLLQFSLVVATDRPVDGSRQGSAGVARPSEFNAWLIGSPRTALAIRRLRVQLIHSCSSRN